MYNAIKKNKKSIAELTNSSDDTEYIMVEKLISISKHCPPGFHTGILSRGGLGQGRGGLL